MEFKRIISVVLALMLVFGVSLQAAEMLETIKDEDAWKENLGTIDVTKMVVAGEGVKVDKNTVKITSGGDFTVTGENYNVLIHVDTNEKVKLRLENVKMANPSNPVIFFENAEKAFITVSKGTENYVTDGEEYALDAKAAIFSNDDIEIKGEGVLYVTSKAHHAIASDDDIKIEEGTLNLAAEKKDGIHANNTIKIKGGSITINAKGDGVQAEEDVVIEGGKVNVVTTGEVEGAVRGGFDRGNMQGGTWGDFRGKKRENVGGYVPSEGMTSRDGMLPPENIARPDGMMAPEGMARPDGMMPPESMTRPDGMMPPEGMTRPEGMMPPEGMAPTEGEIKEEAKAEEDNSLPSTKGIKAETNITISGGEIVVNSADHAVHSAGGINITGGSMSLTSQKGKGISSHGDMIIDAGFVSVLKATEGLESKANFTINGGTINVIGSDDGINAGGTGGRDAVNRQDKNAATGHDLIINGGAIFVDAQGDGLDANGRLIIKGGNIVVEGPTNNGNGALDSGGVIKIDGGNLIALGASGMAESPDGDSKQPAFRLITSENIPSGSNIVIKNAQGEVILNYKTIKSGNSIVFSSNMLVVGETYTVMIGEKNHTVEMTQTVTNVGSGGLGGFGGRRGW